ncbi:MAG: hypothetical protein M3Q34_03195 [bacterium]|nr:hypothetical protein [bacterium]
MTKFSKKLLKKNQGQAMIVSVTYLVFIGIAVVSGLVSPTVRQMKVASNNVMSKQSLYLSESGLEDAFYRIRTNKAVTSPSMLTIGNHATTTTITDSNDEKVISAVGDVLDRERTNELVLEMGTGVNFSYGVQSGTGGFTMANNSKVQGSVYSNGNITGSGWITGTALSANSPALTANQLNDTGVSFSDISFGNANSTQDFAQSFQVSVDGPVNKVDLYLKKVSTPNSLTVRIVADNNGVPSNTTLATGSLSASLISTNYGWVSVPFSTNPELTAGTSYWIVIDGSTSASKYYITRASDYGYSDGNSKIGQYSGSWNDNSPASLDGFFKLYLGGLTGKIDGIEVGTGSTGNAYAHTIDDATVAGIKYCQSTNNSPACNTSLPDPSQVPMPISDQNILDWKAEALANNDTHFGDYTVNGSGNVLGPMKITGNLIFTNNADLTMTGTLWIEGNIEMGNGGTVNLDASYGTGEGVIVADGVVDMGNGVEFNGSGSLGSFVMVLSTSSSDFAIDVSNNDSGDVILYAANGTINLSNNSSAKSLNGKRINLKQNAQVVYDSGIVNSNFVSGPSGGWNIDTWKEVQ